jgi:hypothetical protein
MYGPSDSDSPHRDYLQRIEVGETMSLKRTGSWLATWVLVVAAASLAAAQTPPGHAIGDFQLFSSGEQASLGGGPRANQGLFFTYNGLYWTISAPDTATLGVPAGPENARVVYWGPGDESSATQGSSMNTGFITSTWSGGHEISVGWVREHHGLMFTYQDLHGVTQEETKEFVHVYFDDRVWGAGGYRHLEGDVDSLLISQEIESLPVVYDSVTLRNNSKYKSVALSYLYRQHPMMGGGMFEWIVGARWLQFKERFDVDAIGGILDETHIMTWADNEIIGPEVGLRWFRRSNRWTLSVQGSFVAGTNLQAVRQKGIVGTALGNAQQSQPQYFRPLALRAQSNDDVEHMTEFSPVVDLKIELKWQATRALAFNVGWNGMWMDNIARPTGMVNYELGETYVLGILADKNEQDVFLNGLRAGIEFNR